ncbi:MAG TPA: sugar phosphate isomerase/epimerase family protein [Thermomicrobiales bacterium]
MTTDFPEAFTNFRQYFATRINSFRSPSRTALPDLLRAISAIPGLNAVELNYPQHLRGIEEPSLVALLEENGLTLTALSLRFEAADFALGAFSHPSADVREKAIAVAIEAVELATRLGVPHVNLWMAHDGFDLPFEVDYETLWEREIEGFRRVADHNPSIRISVEYKLLEPRRASLIGSMSDALLAVRDVDRPNFGVQIDFCHSLMARELPAAAAAKALAAGRLFGVHLNDGYGPADDGLPVASVHLWETLELLWYLRRYDYRGTIYFDTFPERVDPAAETAHNIATVMRLERLLDRMNDEEIRAIQARHDALAATRLLQELALNAGG